VIIAPRHPVQGRAAPHFQKMTPDLPMGYGLSIMVDR